MSKIDSGSETQKLRGVSIFGYSPDGMDTLDTTNPCPFCTKIYNATVKPVDDALVANRQKVEAARATGFPGDWKFTKGVFSVLGRVTGFNITNSKPPKPPR